MSDTRVWSRGDREGAVVVFTHGLLDDHRSFDPVLPAFTQAGYRTLTWDLPGHGARSTQDLSVTGAARELLALLDTAGVRRAVLVGHSLGGYVSQEAALQAPDRVAALVVIGTTSLTHRPGALPMAVLRASRVLLWLVPTWLLRKRMAAHSTRTAAAHDHARRTASQVEKRTVTRAWAAFVDAIRHIDSCRRLRVPTLVCLGEHDDSGIIPTAAPRWARVAHLRHHVITGAGHLAHRDNPAETARELLAFLGDTVSRAPAPRGAGRRRTAP